MAKSNKNSSTEDDLGRLHKSITKCHAIKVKTMLKVAEELEKEGYTPEEIDASIDTKALMASQKWVEYNGISCLAAEDDEDSELSQNLDKLKKIQGGNVVEFKDLYEA